MKPAFFGLQNHSFSDNPILIIDRDGLIGELLSLKLSKEFLVVFVSQKKLDLDVENQNIAHVPFLKKFPAIPDNKYSHIIFIDEEKRDLELLPKIIDKVKNVNADLIFAQGMFAKREYEIGKVLRMCPNAKVALFGDIFENRLILKKENFRSVINKYLHQAQKFGKILVPGDGLGEVYPVFLQDVVDRLIDLVCKIHESNSLFYIFPKHPPSALSLAHMIQKNNPEIIIDFTKRDPGTEEIPDFSNGINLLGDKYPLAKRIRGIDIGKKAKMYNNKPHGFVKKLKKAHVFIIWVLIFLLFFPFVFTTIFSFIGLNAFYYAKGEAIKGNFSNTKSSIHLSQTFFYLGKQTLKIFSFQAGIIGQENNLKKLSEDIDLGYTLSEALSQGFNSENYFSKILSGESKTPIEDFVKGESSLKSSIITLDRIKAEGKIPAPILQNLEIINPIIRFLTSVVDIMPNILGMEGSKTYLILFQDNLELRPGGGLIDSYGILRLNMGKITEFSLHNTSDADNQLKGHVEPPFAIRRYLSEQHWYMKDSNFSVDFVKSASSAANFLFVETRQKADGVIAIDTSFIKNILHIIGPVYVANYKEVVSENNLYTLIQSNAGKNFPDQMQKKDFSKSLNKAIVEKIKGKKASYLLIARAISEALAQKHLLIFLDSDSQNILTVNGWSSALWDERKDSGENVNDFVGINEANLGINKANYFMRRLVSQKITLGEDGNVSEELTINYKNDSTAWTGGAYDNYLRVILPKNIKLSEILINDQAQDIIDAVTNPLVYEAKNFKVPQGLEVEKVNEGDKTIFGFLVKIPIGKIVKVKLRYTLSERISGLDAFSYSLKLFKQPGIDSLPYSFSFIYPNSFNVIKRPDEIVRKTNEVTFSEKIITDKNLLINFAKK